MRISAWPELDRLTRFLRAADSLTDTLAAWTGYGVGVQTLRCVDRMFPDPAVAEFLALHEGASVQEREARMSCTELVVADARAWVAVDSPALTPAVRQRLRSGADLGDLLRSPLQYRRVTVRIAAQSTAATHDPGTPVLTVQARLDVAGTPVVWSEETIYEAVFAFDRGRLGGTPLRVLRPPVTA